ncbi:MAG: DUF2585 domain-containing protein [Candidatus Pacebacteria bacterium]|nr:DUF2585 domain-containing protein [Candidatus Paceibacterota bacterium]
MLSGRLTDISWRRVVAGAAALVALQVLALWMMGQPAIAQSGVIKLWEGAVLSSGNSQHITDWYTFSHVIHGLVFYWLLSLAAPRVPVLLRLLFAMGIEVSWEILENTPMVIEHYRQQALAVGYTGDSILNSISDTMAMVAGFVAAWRLPVWGSIMMGLGLEAAALWFIRDGLSLNIVGFVHQFDFITQWQNGE